MSQKKITDEDKMIKRLEDHRDVVGFVVDTLQKNGIDAQRTYDNFPGGDVIVMDEDREEDVKDVLRKLDQKVNKKKK